MALCVSLLIASEFMPVSLLTPIATDLCLADKRAQADAVLVNAGTELELQLHADELLTRWGLWRHAT